MVKTAYQVPMAKTACLVLMVKTACLVLMVKMVPQVPMVKTACLVSLVKTACLVLLVKTVPQVPLVKTVFQVLVGCLALTAQRGMLVRESRLRRWATLAIITWTAMRAGCGQNAQTIRGQTCTRI